MGCTFGLANHFRNIYFHNFDDWSEAYLQMYIPSSLAKFLRLTGFRLLENAFVKLSCSYHDLINNPPRRTVLPINLPKIICPQSAMKSFPPYYMGETLCPCSIEKSSGGVSLNICKKVQNKNFLAYWIWQKGFGTPLRLHWDW